MTQQSTPTQREIDERTLKSSRWIFLIVGLLTVVNVIGVFFGQDFFFYFSASVPFYLAIFFAELCGMRSDAFYEEFYGADWQERYQFLDPSFFYVIAVVALILGLLYFLFWYMSGKSKGWTVAGLIYYAADLVGHLLFAAFVYGFQSSDILVLVFHAITLYLIITAVRAWNRLSQTPPQAAFGGVPVSGAPTGHQNESGPDMVPDASAEGVPSPSANGNEGGEAGTDRPENPEDAGVYMPQDGKETPAADGTADAADGNTAKEKDANGEPTENGNSAE